MSEVIKLYKEIGETPLECILRFKTANPSYQDTKMTYLGRLDPMAEGLLLVLAGDMRDKDKYLAMDKEYEFEVLWGFETDTYDTLGLVHGEGKVPDKLERKIPKVIEHILQKKVQKYPPFSSRVFGKDFLRAREENIEAVDLPERGIRIFSLEHIHTRHVTGREILGEVVARAGKIKQDFRQDEILATWRNTFITRPNEFFLVSKFRSDVSSGTYIRGIAHEMGHFLDTSALAYSIKRVRVGDYRV